MEIFVHLLGYKSSEIGWLRQLIQYRQNSCLIFIILFVIVFVAVQYEGDAEELAESTAMGTIRSVQATYAPILGPHELRLSSGITAFCADYAARLYGYERGLLYAYNYQMYYGTGLRGYLLVQYSQPKPRASRAQPSWAPHATLTAQP